MSLHGLIIRGWGRWSRAENLPPWPPICITEIAGRFLMVSAHSANRRHKGVATRGLCELCAQRFLPAAGVALIFMMPNKLCKGWGGMDRDLSRSEYVYEKTRGYRNNQAISPRISNSKLLKKSYLIS